MKILNNFKNKLSFKNYSNRTIDVYVSYLSKFLNENKIYDPYQLTTKELNDYLINYNYSSISQQNQIISSLKLFYKLVLNKSPKHLCKIERPRTDLYTCFNKHFKKHKLANLEFNNYLCNKK